MSLLAEIGLDIIVNIVQLSVLGQIAFSQGFIDVENTLIKGMEFVEEPRPIIVQIEQHGQTITIEKEG